MNEKDLLIKYIKSRDLVDELTNRLKSAKEVLEVAERTLVESLTAAGAQATAKYENLGRVMLPKPRLYANVLKEKQDELIAYLETTGHEDLVKRGVHPSSLNAFCAQQIEEGNPLPEFINYYFKQGVTLERL